MSAARAIEPGATLAVGDNFAMTTLGAAILGLVTMLAAVLLTVVTYRAGLGQPGDRSGRAQHRDPGAHRQAGHRAGLSAARP